MKTLRHKRSGFTIIEIMLALGIFSMILVSIYSVWEGILKASRAARTAADGAQRARISIRAVEDALVTAQMFTANMPPQNRDAYYSFIADTKGDYGSLSFVAHLPATFPGVGRFGDQIVRRITFTTEAGKDKEGGLNLVMRQGPMLMAVDKDYEPYSLTLAKDVTTFGFEFWGLDKNEWKWLDHWDSTNSLPLLVRVWLGVGKTAKAGQAQDFVARIVSIPAAAVQPEWQFPGGQPGQQGVPGGPRPGQPGQPGQPGSGPPVKKGTGYSR